MSTLVQGHEAQKSGVGVSKSSRLTTIFSTSRDHFPGEVPATVSASPPHRRTYELPTSINASVLAYAGSHIAFIRTWSLFSAFISDVNAYVYAGLALIY
jgi:hypothetical protein